MSFICLLFFVCNLELGLMTTFTKNHNSTKMSLRAWEIKRSRESKHDGERRNSDRSKKEKNRTKQNMFEAKWSTFVTRLPREIKHNAAEVSSNIANSVHILSVINGSQSYSHSPRTSHVQVKRPEIILCNFGSQLGHPLIPCYLGCNFGQESGI